MPCIFVFLFIRKRWKSLGSLSKEDAQREFIKLFQTVSGGKLREWIEQKQEEKRLVWLIDCASVVTCISLNMFCYLQLLHNSAIWWGKNWWNLCYGIGMYVCIHQGSSYAQCKFWIASIWQVVKGFHLFEFYVVLYFTLFGLIVYYTVCIRLASEIRMYVYITVFLLYLVCFMYLSEMWIYKHPHTYTI